MLEWKIYCSVCWVIKRSGFCSCDPLRSHLFVSKMRSAPDNINKLWMRHEMSNTMQRFPSREQDRCMIILVFTSFSAKRLESFVGYRTNCSASSIVFEIHWNCHGRDLLPLKVLRLNFLNVPVETLAVRSSYLLRQGKAKHGQRIPKPWCLNVSWKWLAYHKNSQWKLFLLQYWAEMPCFLKIKVQEKTVNEKL